MGNYRWTGQGHSHRWGDSDNWSPKEVPGEDDDVIIPAGLYWGTPDPAGALVASVRLEGGGLQSRLRVKDRFEWLGGTLSAGLDLGGAALVIRGNGAQTTHGNIRSRDTRLVGADVRMGSGARIENLRRLTNSGDSSLAWIGAQNPFLDNQGTFAVNDGTLTTGDVIGLFEGEVTIAPNAVLRIESATVPSILLDGAIVTGGGRLLVTAGGRLYAVRSAQIAVGTTIELAADGAIEDKRVPALYAAILGPVPDDQTLTVQGQLSWTGGAINGDVVVGPQAVLHAGGRALRQHMGGTIRIDGSGLLTGPSRLEVDIATLRNDGDLVLQGELEMSTGRRYLVDNRGSLRIVGVGTVKLGNNRLVNSGLLEVSQGLLHLAVQAGRYSQTKGELCVAANATLRSDAPIRINRGSLTGGGQIVADLEARGTVQPGSPPPTGTPPGHWCGHVRGDDSPSNSCRWACPGRRPQPASGNRRRDAGRHARGRGAPLRRSDW